MKKLIVLFFGTALLFSTSAFSDVMVGFNGNYGMIIGNLMDLRAGSEKLWGARGTKLNRKTFSLLPLANELVCELTTKLPVSLSTT